jgi:hypothetical protein
MPGAPLALLNVMALGLMLSFIILFLIIYFRLQRSGQIPALRPLPGVQSLRILAERSIEEGRAMHLALGTGRLTDSTTAATLMGLIVLDDMAEQSLRTNQLPIVTTADPVSQLLASDSLSRGVPERVWRTRTFARFVAPQPSAYGAGTRGMMQRENLGLTAAIGYLGDEYLFLAAEQPNGGEPMYAPDVAATTHLETLPLIHLTARTPLLGEEIFALGAYISQWPSHLASVLLQDVGRIVVLLAIIVGVILRTIGVF